MTTFSKGDRVEFNQNYDQVKIGDKGTVTGLTVDLLCLKMDNGLTKYCFPYRVTKINKIKEPKFKVGQRVVAKSGFAYKEHDIKPLVVLADFISDNGTKTSDVYGVGPVGNDASLAHSSKGWFAYREDHLEAYEPTFNVGDYVEVWGLSWGISTYEGRKGRVVDTYDPSSKAAKIEFDDDRKPSWGTFNNEVLRKAVRPVVKRQTALEKSGLKIGDKVRVVASGDYGVAATYKGQVGTITAERATSYIPVSLESGKYLLMEANELELYKPTLLEQHGFELGDKVRARKYAPALSTDFNNNGGTITGANSSFIKTVSVNGATGWARPDEIELVPAAPELKVGDYVVVDGYGNDYDGTKGEVTKLNTYRDGWVVIKEQDKSYELQFPKENLKLAERPLAASVFSIGDWVEVHGRNDKWDGTQGEVTSLPPKDDFYNFITIKDAAGERYYFETKKLKKAERPVKKTILEEAGVKIGDKVYWSGVNDKLLTVFRENGATVTRASTGGGYIRVNAEGINLHLLPEEITLEKPVVKSWAELAEIGETFVTKDTSGRVSRFLTKVGVNDWVRQYPNSKSIHADLTNLAVEFYGDEKYYSLSKV